METQGHGLIEQTEISTSDAAHEHLLMNLRLRDGLDLPRYESRWGTHVERSRLNELEQHGLLYQRGNHVMATPRGRLVLNSVVAALV